MAVTLDETVGGTEANTYVTLAQANTYFEGRLNTDDWDDAASDDIRNRALVTAAKRLDQVRWKSQKADATQALEWPRWDIEDQDGNSIGSDTVPQAIKDAQCELALSMLAEDLLADTGMEGFESVKVGPLSVTPKHSRRAGELPENVYREIKQFLQVGRGQVRLMRA